MSLSTSDTLRATVAALMRLAGETQHDLAAGMGLGQAAVSKKLSGRVAFSLADVDALAAHYGIPVPDLLAGPTHATAKLPIARLTQVVGGHQATIPTS
ncbi:helix-turn-helix transcriptional regulator [Streptomyces sp. 71268]|uniref:helix-turn-helix domain-containing protein n=1 Tax=Streptomyces sp. 71268 TaxID=3002640 RepID=UPI0023FA2EBB|nr:helix-turn-helix transcriptional regulator [Streptomyces sp. 71268]WEV23756.1 helix-turn-helix transcriptional regulator [Streptomyces sp. 71268]WEV29541.1 helix-turn-helix transcriptional regulator [Streptomyces sp. 71268]